MKNIVTCSILIYSLIIGGSSLFGQSRPMVKGKKVVMAGVGMGGYQGTASPSIMVSYQQGIVDNWNNGNLSIGGTVAFKSGHFRNYTLSRVGYSYVAIAGRASYHPYFVKSDTWDVYGGLGLGFYSVSSTLDIRDYGIAASASAIAFTIHMGARYEINENWGAWAELGNELSVLSIGAAYKIK